MNHIEYYQAAQSDLDLPFETRHYMTAFHNMSLDRALESLEEIYEFIHQKHLDFLVLKQQELKGCAQECQEPEVEHE